jgi:hypothetical protein
VALASNGGTASASSVFDANYPAERTNNGDRKGIGWGTGNGGWNDATPDAYPDWLEIAFSGTKLIEEIGVVTLQDDFQNPVEPVAFAANETQSYSPLAVPLETLVERERVRGGDDLRQSAEAGLHFLRLLAAHGLGHYRQAYVNEYQLKGAPASPRSDGDSARFAAVVARRVPDGRRLYDELRDALLPSGGRAASLPAAPAVANEADRRKITAVAEAWLGWYESLFSEHGAGVSPWVAERMEYEFAVAARAGAGRVEMVAPEYAEGHLDWHSFDARLDPADKATNPEAAVVVSEAIPTPVSYRGMPASRYWEFEDAQVSWGEVEAGAADLARLMLIEFALIYGNDWFVIPVDVRVGSACLTRSLVVTDTFGVRTLVPHYSEVDGEESDWRMFNLSPDGAAATPPPHLFLPPALAASLESAPVEEVLFLRDEMANTAWGVERVVENLLGRPVSRYENYQESRRARAQAVAQMSAQEITALAYRLGSEVPDYWIPLLPVQVAPRSYRLRRGAVLDADSREAIKPLGRILEPQRALTVNEEEVPRAGIRVTRAYQYARWIDGSAHLWVGRRKRPGRGEGSSGLRFDTVEERRG